MDYSGRIGYDERTIGELVHKIYDAFGKAIGLLDDQSNDEDMAELRDTLNEQRTELLQTFERYSKLAGSHFNLDRQTQRALARQLYMLSTDVVDLLLLASNESMSVTTSGTEKPYDLVDYSHLRIHTLVISSQSQEILTTFFNRISSWAVPLNTLPPLAQTTGSVPDLPTYNLREDLVIEHHLKDAAIPSDPSAFVYDKLLTAYSFRLLKISGERPYMICEVRTFSLQDYEPYQAVSYCWGSSTQDSTIRCNNRKLRISSGLKEGLQRLYEYTRTSGREWFWVDQICINQHDNAERTQQVRIMRVIYQRSMSTIIWLPIKNGIARSAKSIISDTYLYISALKRETLQQEIHLTRGNTTDLDVGFKLPPATDKRWSALANLLESPWFERCWVLQEIAVSKGYPMILCGDQHILWSVFQEVVIWLNRAGMGYRTQRMELVNSIQEIIGRRVWGDNDLADTVSQLHVLLRLTGSFRSTDPRDKIFALLGLSCETRDPDHWPQELIPDYNRSVQDVYAAATKYCIRQTNGLSVLSQYEYESIRGTAVSGASFPSWVPRWDLANSIRRISAFSLCITSEGYQTLTEKFNKASRNMPTVTDNTSPANILRLLGVRINPVTICLPTVTVNEPDFHAGVPERYLSYLAEVVPTLYIMCKDQVSQNSSESFDKTFFVVTTAGLTAKHEDAGLEPLIHFREFLAASHGLRQHLTPTKHHTAVSNFAESSTHRTSLAAQLGLFRTLPSQARNDGSGFEDLVAQRYVITLQRLMNRRLFITASGHLGLGPASMMSGDIVAVLFGGNVPYVLRPLENEQWHFVGECYLDGYMRGEAMDNEGKDRQSHEWFELV